MTRRRSLRLAVAMLLVLGSAIASMSARAANAGSRPSSATGDRSAQGDFNDDGFRDLAVGIPQENVGDIEDAGAVQVIYGAADGLNGDSPIDDQFWHQASQGVPGSPEAGERFGSSLAWGDFDGNGFDDLAIGVPFQDYSSSGNIRVDAGLVHVLYGSGQGLTVSGTETITQRTSTGVLDAEPNEVFGSSLAAGNFNGDARDDLAIGAPGQDVGSATDAGAVNVVLGTSSGLASGQQLWTQGNSGVQGAVESADRFGSSLAAANLGGTTHADLAVGVPREDVGTLKDAGAVNVLYGSASGLGVAGNQLWHQNSPEIGGAAEQGDLFGAPLAAANFGRTSEADLAVGAPYEDLGVVDAGNVNVIYGSASGLASANNQLWNMDTSGIAPTPAVEDRLGFALAGANFGKTSHADLAIGIPYDDPDDTDAGTVFVVYGSSGGLASAGYQFWSQDSNPGGAGGCTGFCIEGETESGDHFGKSLAGANFGKSALADLAIGAPDENYDPDTPIGLDPPPIREAGAVNVIYGSSEGLNAAEDQAWDQANDRLKDSAEVDDLFGAVLA